MSEELFKRYAELLRRAWLNPSHAPWQKDVYDFEHEHYDELRSHFIRWQENA